MASSTQSEKSFHGQGAAVAETAKEAAGNVADAAKNAAKAVADKAGELATNVGKKAEDATAAVGSSFKSLGGTVREKGPGGVFGGATSAVADTLETSGRYLEEYGLSGLGQDMTNLIRRNPIPALLIGIGLGFMIARATRS